MAEDKSRLDEVFIDSHLHLYNLSHPGFLAFINRFFLNNKINLNKFIRTPLLSLLLCIFSSDRKMRLILKRLLMLLILPLTTIILYAISKFVFYDWLLKVPAANPFMHGVLSLFSGIICTILLTSIVIRRILGDKPQKVVNMLAIMENDIGSMLQQLELDYFAGSLQAMGLISNPAGKKNSNAHIKEDLLYELIDAHLKNKEQNTYFFKIDEHTLFKKIILTPLMMDFDSKGYTADQCFYYNQTPQKPIIEQMIDVCNGIKRYLEKSKFRLLEIYPFMGINPGSCHCVYREEDIIAIPAEEIKYYREVLRSRPVSVIKKVECFKAPEEADLCSRAVLIPIEKITDNEKKQWEERINFTGTEKIKVKAIIDKIAKQAVSGNSIQKMVYKYFGRYNGNDTFLYDRFRKTFNHYFYEGHYTGDIDKLRSYFFAGIKFYPGLGFDPWPEKDSASFSKIKFLYNFCSQKKIPITVHCQHSSFQTVSYNQKEEYTSPDKWEKVLSRYPELKVNFAHMGFYDRPANHKLNTWTKKVINYINHKDWHIYADFAAHGIKVSFYDFYKQFKIILGKKNINKDRILFGSDFMLHLIKDNSYRQYLETFFNDVNFRNDNTYPKAIFYNKNPKRFLFNIDDA